MLHDCVKPRGLTGQNISICLFVWLIEMISALDCFAFCALLDYLEKYQKVQMIITQWRNAIETAIILQLCRIALIVILWDSLLETSDKWMWQKIWRFKLIWDRIHLDSNLRNSTHFQYYIMICSSCCTYKFDKIWFSCHTEAFFWKWCRSC